MGWWQWAPEVARHNSRGKTTGFLGPPSLVLGSLLNGVILSTGRHGQVTHVGGAATPAPRHTESWEWL